MNPIKVTHIVSVDKENYYLNNLIDFTDSREVEFSFITFASLECDFVRDMQKRGKSVYGLNTLSRKSYYQAFSKIGKILKAENPDIVHTHLFDPTVIGLTIAKWQKRKTVFTRHHSDAFHKLTSYAKRTFYLKWENRNNRKADHIIAPSQMVRDILIENENVPATKVSIIPYGQTVERFNTVTKDKIEKIQTDLGMKNFTLVCNSRLFHQKGHKYLFEAFASLVKDGLDATLFLIGTGDNQQSLEKLTSDYQIKDKVKFLGWRDDALVIMAAADIIVHPSLEDALSSAVIESLMLNKPIIATDISGVRDSLGNGKYGTIVPPADSQSFRIAIQDVIKNFETAKKKAENGREYLLDYMNAKNVANQYKKVYSKILQK